MNRKIKVVIGDDSLEFGTSFGDILLDKGFDVSITPKDGAAVLDKIQSDRPDVCLLYTSIPGVGEADREGKPSGRPGRAAGQLKIRGAELIPQHPDFVEFHPPHPGAERLGKRFLCREICGESGGRVVSLKQKFPLSGGINPLDKAGVLDGCADAPDLHQIDSGAHYASSCPPASAASSPGNS